MLARSVPALGPGGYLAWTRGSMRPAGLVAVCNEMVHGARTRIVECGSSVSTVVLARLLRERHAGDLSHPSTTVTWAGLVQDHSRREALDTIARVLHAPLHGEPLWYRLAGLGEVPDEVDLVIVDGPPACEPGHARAASRRCRGSPSALSLAQRSSSMTSPAPASARSSRAGRRQPTGASP